MPPETRDHPIATSIVFAAEALLLACVGAILHSGAFWIAGLTAVPAGLTAMALYVLRHGRLRHSSLLTLVSGAFTLTISLMSFGLATLHKGPGLILSTVLLVSAATLFYGFFRMRPGR